MNTPQHHPDKNLLTEYAAGTLARAPAIAVKTHLHYCQKCRLEVRQLEEIGAALFVNSHNEQPAETTTVNATETAHNTHFVKLMSAIDDMEMPNQNSNTAHASTEENKTKHTLSSKYATLPELVKKMMANHPLTWRRSTKNLRSASLVANQDQYAVSLQKIRAGSQVPEHEHLGDEMTVVLKGSFSDEDNIYQEGDFLAKSVGDKHRPMASSNEDCLCLSVEQAPVRLTGMFTRLFNPFISIARV